MESRMKASEEGFEHSNKKLGRDYKASKIHLNETKLYALSHYMQEKRQGGLQNKAPSHG